jgi:hypothetical protein
MIAHYKRWHTWTTARISNNAYKFQCSQISTYIKDCMWMTAHTNITYSCCRCIFSTVLTSQPLSHLSHIDRPTFLLEPSLDLNQTLASLPEWQPPGSNRWQRTTAQCIIISHLHISYSLSVSVMTTTSHKLTFKTMAVSEFSLTF